MKTKAKRLIRNVTVQLFLAVVAYFMLFPFTYMVTSSLKTPTDTFRVPPKLLPRDQERTDVAGIGEDLPLFYVDSGGERKKLALAQKNIPIGIFARADDPAVTYERFLSEAQPVLGPSGEQESLVVGGAETALWSIEDQGKTIQATMVTRTSVGSFVDPDEPSSPVYANVRLSEPVENVSWHPENYREVFELQGLFRSLTNTILVTILVVIGQIVTSVMGGYAFARLKFPGRSKLFLIYLGTYMIPFVILIIPLYQVMKALNWVNTMTALVVPWVFTVYGTFLMRQFFLAIPKELEEAAYMDGASRWLMLKKIFIPAVMPGIATLATFTFLYAWNSFLWPLIIIKIGSENAVLTLALSQLQGRASDKLNLILAGAAVTILPPVLVFISMQKYYLSSIMTSGLKG
ncbi:MAG: carbohydrate ABC transporter permease [Spirochaetales bacterium]|nr:MAG: carbohydrate ABC transporter permease [Spirochaetales bacterium]